MGGTVVVPSMEIGSRFDSGPALQQRTAAHFLSFFLLVPLGLGVRWFFLSCTGRERAAAAVKHTAVGGDGERSKRCQWQVQRGERVAAVGRIEERRKPEDFTGYRNRGRGFLRSPSARSK